MRVPDESNENKNKHKFVTNKTNKNKAFITRRKTAVVFFSPNLGALFKCLFTSGVLSLTVLVYLAVSKSKVNAVRLSGHGV